MNKYIGHKTQVVRVEEHRLVGGKGDGIRLLEVDNGIGLHMTLSIDRALDISRLSLRGINMGYFSPAGYTAPAFYREQKFLKNFTAGFLTTCGLEAVGSPCVDDGEELPLHGTVSNIPAENVCYCQNDEEIIIRGEIADQVLFGRKFRLERKITVSLKENVFSVEDLITNEGDKKEPYEVLYHMNMGYPLLDEDSIVKVNSNSVSPRDDEAAKYMDTWNAMEKPQPQFQERCYYHSIDGKGVASIFQPKLKFGLAIEFDSADLDCLTEWKMMGERDYVLGLEPGNCYPDGRSVMREKGILKFLSAGESKTLKFKVKLIEE